MPHYDNKNKILIKEQIYLYVPLQTFRTSRGVTHCHIDQALDATNCSECGEPISPVTCYVTCVIMHILAEGMTPEASIQKAKRMIDKVRHDSGVDDPEDDDDESGNDDDDDEDETGKGKPDKKGDDKSPAAKPNLTPEMEKMVKLGWPARLRSLAQECDPTKSKKPVTPKK